MVFWRKANKKKNEQAGQSGDKAQKVLLDALADITLPGDQPLLQSGRLSEILIRDGKILLTLNADPDQIEAYEGIRRTIEQRIKGVAGEADVFVSMTAERGPGQPGSGGLGVETSTPASRKKAAQQSARSAPQSGKAGGLDLSYAKNIIAVASGKGGVGKSTTSANLALGLAGAGLRVGILDADIYGPSLPRLFGASGKLDQAPSGKIMPKERMGVKVMSVGFMIDEDAAMIWRGPMVASALVQMLRDVEWGELDVLVVDMPPGTGDAQLTMAQQVPLSGAVIVSTPQDLALLDARKGITMFEKVNIPIIGLIENMSYFLCPSCGDRSDIFGHGGARDEAERLSVPFLGEIPLHMAIRESADAGEPVTYAEPESLHASLYRAIADQVWAALNDVDNRLQKPAPRIVIEPRTTT